MPWVSTALALLFFGVSCIVLSLLGWFSARSTASGWTLLGIPFEVGLFLQKIASGVGVTVGVASLAASLLAVIFKW